MGFLGLNFDYSYAKLTISEYTWRTIIHNYKNLRYFSFADFFYSCVYVCDRIEMRPIMLIVHLKHSFRATLSINHFVSLSLHAAARNALAIRA